MRSIFKIGIAFTQLLWANACPAITPTPWCTFLLGELGTNERGELALQAYRALLNRFGAGLSPKRLQEMIEGEDPFAAPESAEGLRRTLAQFREMLVSGRLDTPELRNSLLKELSERIQETEIAMEKRAKAITQTSVELSYPELALKGGHFVPTGSPTSIAVEAEYGLRFRFRDGATGHTSELKFGRNDWHTAVSGDGRFVVSVRHGDIEVRRITDGKIEADVRKLPVPPDGSMWWKRMTKLLRPVGRPRKVRTLPGSSRVLLEHPDNHGVNYTEHDGPVAKEYFGLTLFDPETGAKKKINVDAVLDGGFTNHWGFVPGTDLWFFDVQAQEEVHLPPRGDKIWLELRHGNHQSMARFDVKTKAFDLQVTVPEEGAYALTQDGENFYHLSGTGFKVLNMKRWAAKEDEP